MTTATHPWLEELQSLVTNQLNLEALRGRRIAAILGDTPSTYAKSPRLWNAAFTALAVDATYVPLDVPADRLPAVLHVLRSAEEFLGGSVTVPYKGQVLPLLDRVDSLAARIGAVNVIARSPEGRLTGYNTDGLGGVQALTQPILPGQVAPFTTLTGLRTLLIGTGGAGQALAVYLWERLGSGELVIANRTAPPAQALVKRLQAMRPGRLTAVSETDIPRFAQSMDLIVNATIKGQAGIRTLDNGRLTTLEPYSSLGPATPADLPADTPESEFRSSWLRQSWQDVQENQAVSLELCVGLPRACVCYDIIYAPQESVFLQQARWSGHRTLNGKAMNVVQAVEAFTRYVCRDWLAAEGWNETELTRRVTAAMLEEWAK